MSDNRIVVIGTGPAGVRAAETLHAAGMRSFVVISEAPADGGQIYRRQPAGFTRRAEEVYGDVAHRAISLHQAFERIRPDICYRPSTLVWNIMDSMVFTLGPGGIDRIPFERLIVATGAMDRILQLPGWTIPGVFTLGGAQIALKHQACVIGSSVIFMGTGPLLYLVAYQYAKAGAKVAAVLDTSSKWNKRLAIPWLLRGPEALRRGLHYRSFLRRHGIAIHEGVRPLRIRGTDRVSGVEFADSRGKERLIACDAVGQGFGLSPELQLAELAGCRLEFDSLRRQWTVAHDGKGRAGPGIYVAGDAVAIGGADMAELAGASAARSLLEDMGREPVNSHGAGAQHDLRRLAKFQDGIARAFPYPHQYLASVPDETILCRCESVTFGEVRRAIDTFGATEVNRVKALVRPGMGRCQGRVCGGAVAELVAQRLGVSVETVGRFRGQAPVKPLPYDAAAARAAESIEEWLKAPTTQEVV